MIAWIYVSDQQQVNVRLSVSRGRRIALWIIFVGLVAVASSIVTAVVGYTLDKTPSMKELFAEGDGLLIVVAITADAIGRAVERKQSHTIRALACALVFALALLVFGITKTQMQNHRDEIESAVSNAAHLAPEQALKGLETALNKSSYDQERLLTTSVVLLVAGLASAFWVIIGLEEE